MVSESFWNLLINDCSGYGLGLLALRSFIDNLPGFGSDTIILAPCPINPEMLPKNSDGTAQPVLSKQEREQPEDKLAKYYSLMGFNKWSTPEDDAKGYLTFFGTATCWVSPAINTIVPHFFEITKSNNVSMEVDDAGETTLVEDEMVLDALKTHKVVPETARYVRSTLNEHADIKAMFATGLGKHSPISSLGIEDHGRFRERLPNGYFSIVLEEHSFYMGADGDVRSIDLPW